MSDADAFDSTLLDTTMKGQSRLIVIMAKSQTVRDSAKKLKALGKMVRVGRGVFLLHGQLTKDNLVLQDLPTISFQKTREIPSASDHGEDASFRRVYAVVSYQFKNPTATQKKRVERLVRKSVSIRLRPGVLLFPVLKSKDRRKLSDSDDISKFIDSRRISEELRSLGADVSRWSRLRMIEHPLKVESAVARTHAHDISSFEKLVNDIRSLAKDSEAEVTILKKRYSVLSRRYRQLKIKWELARKIWNYDATRSLIRSYNMMIAARRTIESLE